jgi:hypothetical protein
VTRRGVILTASTAVLSSPQAQYDRDDQVILPKLIEPELLDLIVKRFESARFVARNHAWIEQEFCMADHVTAVLLMFLPNNPAFLRIVEQITGCLPLGEFQGRACRMVRVWKKLSPGCTRTSKAVGI